MALGDVVSNALIRVKADTSQAKAELRSLRGEERKAAQERLGEMEKQNSGIDKQIAMWGKAALAVGAGVAAFKLANAAANSYLEDVRLQSAAAGANMDRLKEATRGLVEEDRLLAFAGKSMHGVWRLSQKEMETVLRGADALSKTMGTELQPTVDALTEAITKGSTRALKEFGIEAKDKTEAIKKLDEIYQSLGGNVEQAGDAFKQSKVSMANALDNLMGQLGQLAVSLTPVISLLGSAVEWIGNMVTGLNMLFGAESPWEKARKEQVAALNRENDIEVYSGLGALMGKEGVVRGQIWAESNQETVQFIQQLLTAAGKKPAASKSLARGGSAKPTGLSLESLGGLGGFGAIPGALADAGKAYGGEWLGKVELEQQLEVMDLAADRIAAAKKRIAAADEREANKRASEMGLLASIFGTPSEINELTVAISAASSAFSTLVGAAGSAFDAWITGSESIGMAFKKAVAEGLKANAVQMLGEAIKHGAFALGSLAFFNYASAAQHGAAAAKYLAGAAAMGVFAKALGGSTGQWSQGGGAGAGAGSGGGAARTIGSGGSREQDQRPINVYVGAEWAAMSKLEQSSAIVRAIELGKRGSRHIRRS